MAGKNEESIRRVLRELQRGRCVLCMEEHERPWFRPREVGGRSNTHHKRTLARFADRGEIARLPLGAPRARKGTVHYRCLGVEACSLLLEWEHRQARSSEARVARGLESRDTNSAVGDGAARGSESRDSAVGIESPQRARRRDGKLSAMPVAMRDMLAAVHTVAEGYEVVPMLIAMDDAGAEGAPGRSAVAIARRGGERYRDVLRAIAGARSCDEVSARDVLRRLCRSGWIDSLSLELTPAGVELVDLFRERVEVLASFLSSGGHDDARRQEIAHMQRERALMLDICRGKPIDATEAIRLEDRGYVERVKLKIATGDDRGRERGKGGTGRGNGKGDKRGRRKRSMLAVKITAFGEEIFHARKLPGRGNRHALILA